MPATAGLPYDAPAMAGFPIHSVGMQKVQNPPLLNGMAVRQRRTPLHCEELVMTPEEFRRTGHALVDWIAEYRAGMERLPVMSPAPPGAIRAQLPAAPPERGAPLDAALADLDRIILPGITHWNHPGFFAYFPSNTSLASLLADLAAAGLGAQCMSWQTSPAATELEEVVMDWLRQM